MCVNEWHVRSVPDYRSIELSVKFERLGQDGPFYILRDFIKIFHFFLWRSNLS